MEVVIVLGVFLTVYYLVWRSRRGRKEGHRPDATGPEASGAPEVLRRAYEVFPTLSSAQLFCLDCANDGKPLDLRGNRLQAKTVVSLLKRGLLEGDTVESARITDLGQKVVLIYHASFSGLNHDA